MARTDYATPATPAAEQLVADLFDIGGVGYVSLGAGPEVLMRQAPGLSTTTTPESNFYEELLVNPTVLKLVTQRAELDCGGLRYIAIGYGDFVELIMNTRSGHLSMGVSRKVQAADMAARVREVLERHCELPEARPKALLA